MRYTSSTCYKLKIAFPRECEYCVVSFYISLDNMDKYNAWKV